MELCARTPKSLTVVLRQTNQATSKLEKTNSYTHKHYRTLNYIILPEQCLVANVRQNVAWVVLRLVSAAMLQCDGPVKSFMVRNIQAMHFEVKHLRISWSARRPWHLL